MISSDQQLLQISHDACDAANFVPIAFGRELLRGMFPDVSWDFPKHFRLVAKETGVRRQLLMDNRLFAEATAVASAEDKATLRRIGMSSGEFSALNQALNGMSSEGRAPSPKDIEGIVFAELAIPVG